MSFHGYVKGDNLSLGDYFKHVCRDNHFLYSSRWIWWKQTTLYWCVPLSIAGLLIETFVIYGGINATGTIDWALGLSLFFLPFICILPPIWCATYYYSFMAATSIKTTVSGREKGLPERITEWLQQIDRPTPDDIKALNIGLFEAAPSGFALYLIGAKHYDADNDDWACDEDFVPDPKYLSIPSELTDKMTWETFQDAVAAVVAKYKKEKAEDPSSLFYHKIVTVGFDDGNLVRI